MAPSHLQGESFRLDFQYGSRFSKTRDAIFLNSSKCCLTNYIEILNMFSPLIPPEKRERLREKRDREIEGQRTEKEREIKRSKTAV